METNNLEYVELIIKSPAELKNSAQEVDTLASGEEYLINNQWWTLEMEALLPANRNIVAFKELDYFVWAAGGEEFRVEAGMTVNAAVAPVTNAPSPNPITSATPSSTTVVEPVKNPFEDNTKIYKAKPKTRNLYPIEVGDFVLVNGLSIPQVVTNIINDGDCVLVNDLSTPQVVTNTINDGAKYKVEVAGTTTSLLSTQVFPVYPLDTSGSTPEIEIGDVIDTQRYGVVYVTDGETIKKIKESGVGSYKMYRHTDPNNKLIPRQKLKKYSTGEYVDVKSGERLKGTALGKALEARFQPSIEEIDSSFEIEVIAKHYGIKPEQVKPKEVQILKTLEVLLDHPDCVKDKEWAMIVGPSGSGKTTVAVEYAESKGLDYIIQGGSAQLTVDDLLGYNSITTGEYFPSLLRDAIENGKVFILDEIDACSTNTLLCLNAFKRDEVQFPDKIIKAHPDFRFIATANTLMYSEDYNGRSAMDRATIKRFSVLFYDLTKAELAVRYGFEETKDLVSNVTDKKAYSTSEYKLVHGCILEPTGDYDPRDIQRLVRSNRLEKEGAFKF